MWLPLAVAALGYLVAFQAAHTALSVMNSM